MLDVYYKVLYWICFNITIYRQYTYNATQPWFCPATMICKGHGNDNLVLNSGSKSVHDFARERRLGHTLKLGGGGGGGVRKTSAWVCIGKVDNLITLLHTRRQLDVSLRQYLLISTRVYGTICTGMGRTISLN